MSDERLRRALHDLGAPVDPNPEDALRRLMPRARRSRGIRRLASAGIGAVAVAALAFAAPLVLRGLDLPASPGPMPGPAAGDLTPSPGTTSARESCLHVGGQGPSEIDDAPSLCGVVPVARRVEGGTAYRVTTTTGESFWIVMSDALRDGSDPIVVPGVLVAVEGRDAHEGPLADLTTAEPAEAARQACRPQICEERTTILVQSGPTINTWAGEGTEVSTVDLGRWTLVLCCEALSVQEQIARAFIWDDRDDLFLTLGSTDPEVAVSADWASVLPLVQTSSGSHTMRILPGCSLGGRDPDLGGRSVYGPDLDFSPGKDDKPEGQARWCDDGEYLIDLDEVTLEEAERFHQWFDVTASLEAG
jgi:hypothetical protein